MKEKYASITAYESAMLIDKEIENLDDGEIKKGKIMIASQLFFYAGENALKYILDLGDVPLGRDSLYVQVISNLSKSVDEKISEEIEELYTMLLPKKDGGLGFRNMGSYYGKNSNIYSTHKKFATLFYEIIIEK